MISSLMGVYGDVDAFRDALSRLRYNEGQVTANTSTMELVPVGDGMSVLAGDEMYSFAFNEALSQFLSTACGPHARSAWLFAEMAGGEARDLVLQALNAVLADTFKDVVFHVYDGEIAGVTSNRYVKVYDEIVAFPLEDAADTFVYGKITPNYTLASYECKRFKPEKVGDEFGAGFQVKNNQWGRHSLSVNSFVMRLACLNGAVGMESVVSFKGRHVGESLMSDFWSAIRRMVRKSDDLARMVNVSVRSRIDKPEILVDNVLRRVGRKKLHDHVMTRLASFRDEIGETGKVSHYSMANAISRVGVDMPEYRQDMEIAAGIVYAMASA